MALEYWLAMVVESGAGIVVTQIDCAPGLRKGTRIAAGEKAVLAAVETEPLMYALFELAVGQLLRKEPVRLTWNASGAPALRAAAILDGLARDEAQARRAAARVAS